MRTLLIASLVVTVAGCSGSSTAPSAISAGNTMSIAGTWNGTIASSNNATMQVVMTVTQSSSDFHGSWNSTTVSWSGEITGTVRGSTIDGQFTFMGTAAGGTICTGTATVAGTATAATMTLNSASGVVGPACPAPLPVGVTVDLRRQS
jgi:hypothetical protein